MNNTVAYSVTPKKNPSNPEMPARYFAVAQSKGIVDVYTLSNQINSMCTVTPPDVIAVLTALQIVMATYLISGKIVRLGTFGSFGVSISSAGAATREEFSAQLIYGARYVFRPGQALTSALKNIKYEQVPTRWKHKKKHQRTGLHLLNPIPI